MQHWKVFKYRGHFNFDHKAVKRQWARLHACDREPMPQQSDLLSAWAHFHNGDFAAAYHAAADLGAAGTTLANRAACTYADYVETDPMARLDLFQQVATRASAQTLSSPSNANAFYLLAYALARYSQGISVARALAQGLGSTVKQSLEAAIRLEPTHAEACIALGAFHAEVIDKVGALIGNMTYGAKRDTSLLMLEQGRHLLPRSALPLTEYALALVILDGDVRREEAQALFNQAAALQPLDALELLHIEAAKAGLPPEPDPVTGNMPL